MSQLLRQFSKLGGNERMSKALNKTQRWLRIQQTLSRFPDGMKLSDLVKELGIHRSTIYRDIEQLSEAGVPIWQDDGLIGLLFENMISNIKLSIHESLSLFISLRLLSRQSGEYDPHIISLLEKIANTLPPNVAEHIQQSAKVIKEKRRDDRYIKHLELLMNAWVTRRRIRMVYTSRRSENAKSRLFDVYFIEPLEQVYSCYVIGMDHDYGEVRTFKVKRIQEIELLDEFYEPAESIELFKRWANSWGIVMAPGNDVINIKLRFSSNLAFMVKEAVWHSTQKIEDLEDGGCIFSAKVDHTFGIKIWIRSWGPDVEVLEPRSLRTELAYEYHILRNIYHDVDLEEMKEYTDKYLL